MTRTGILGGTFDPPHNAHVAMAKVASDCIPLDRVLFMPAPHPPHKAPETLTPFETRVRMAELAVRDDARFVVSRLEQFREGPSYTVELLRHYRSQHEDEDVYLILGADSVADLVTWREPEQILYLATLVIFPRSGYSRRVPIEGDASVVLFESPLIDVSSSDIRDRVRRGESIASQVPLTVQQFILDNALYT